MAQLRGDYELMLESARLAAELGVPGSGMWFASLDLQSWAHLELGDLPSAVVMADTDQDRAHHYGDRSAIVVPILVYALCLQALGEPEPAANAARLASIADDASCWSTGSASSTRG